jgi:L-ascorbate metabolism protein UlaG (beta-lactamase superfamily)
LGTGSNRLGLRELASKKCHHGPDRFHNPFSDTKFGDLWGVVSWKLFHRNRFASLYDQEPVVPVSINWEDIRAHKGLSVTFIRHACVLIQDQGRYLLVDPVFFDIFWFIKDFSPLTFDIQRMPRPDHVLITHGHYDHLDKRSLKALPRDTHVISPLGYHEVFRPLSMSRRTQLDWFETYREGELEITLLPCNHWTMRNPLIGPNRSLWGSFLIKTASGPTVYISGDTAYFEGLREIGKEFAIDLAIFNLGAYEPRWFMAPHHLNPRETVRAFQELGARHLAIVHWGTFRLGDEPVHYPPLDIRREMEREGLLDRLVHINHGGSFLYDQGSGARPLPHTNRTKGLKGKDGQKGSKNS